MDYIYSFEKLEVWKFAREYVKKIYELTLKFSNTEKFGLTQQIQRAAVSISSNIAEGSGRTSPKEQKHFVEIAYGSLMETFSQLYLAYDLGYIDESDLVEIKPLINNIAAQLCNLRKSIIDRESNS
ncbi:MAG: four helix bundle protein [Salinivirgaceae bacterium]|nr:four helix bundle protein [Salinivirgaceae bacterium]